MLFNCNSIALLAVGLCLPCIASLRITMVKDVLYDVRVSNHGARLRIMIKEKGLSDTIEIKSPADLGGLKADAYLKLNPLGKMPLYAAYADNSDIPFAIPESDCIARYINDQFSQSGPSFLPDSVLERSLCDILCRLHDVVISPIQGCMYRAPGSIFGIYGSDRVQALAALKKQLGGIEDKVEEFYRQFPSSSAASSPFLCGDRLSLADATLFPTMVFCAYMLPKFFGWKESEFLGPNLAQWWAHLSTEVAATKEVREEIELALQKWEESGRWNPIIEEMKSLA